MVEAIISIHNKNYFSWPLNEVLFRGHPLIITASPATNVTDALMVEARRNEVRADQTTLVKHNFEFE